MKYLLILLFAALLIQPLHGQQTVARAVVEGGDTIPLVTLRAATVVDLMGETGRRELKKHRRLIRDIKIVMPYAKLAAKKMYDLNKKMAEIENPRERKEFMEREEKELFAEFEDDLKELNFRQGRLLLKLIDRETDKAAYYIIKDYRSGFTAFFWQGFAKVFNMNLKEEYDPEEEPHIEAIIHMLGYS